MRFLKEMWEGQEYKGYTLEINTDRFDIGSGNFEDETVTFNNDVQIVDKKGNIVARAKGFRNARKWVDTHPDIEQIVATCKDLILDYQSHHLFGYSDVGAFIKDRITHHNDDLISELYCLDIKTILLNDFDWTEDLDTLLKEIPELKNYISICKEKIEEYIHSVEYAKSLYNCWKTMLSREHYCFVEYFNAGDEIDISVILTPRGVWEVLGTKYEKYIGDIDEFLKELIQECYSSYTEEDFTGVPKKYIDYWKNLK